MIHGTLLVTDQVHSRPAVTVRRPLPPDAPTDGIEFATVIAHLSRDGFVTVVDDVPHPAFSNARAQMKQKTSRILVLTFNTFFVRSARSVGTGGLDVHGFPNRERDIVHVR